MERKEKGRRKGERHLFHWLKKRGKNRKRREKKQRRRRPRGWWWQGPWRRCPFFFLFFLSRYQPPPSFYVDDLLEVASISSRKKKKEREDDWLLVQQLPLISLLFSLTLKEEEKKASWKVKVEENRHIRLVTGKLVTAQSPLLYSEQHPYTKMIENLLSQPLWTCTMYKKPSLLIHYENESPPPPPTFFLHELVICISCNSRTTTSSGYSFVTSAYTRIPQVLPRRTDNEEEEEERREPSFSLCPGCAVFLPSSFVFLHVFSRLLRLDKERQVRRVLLSEEKEEGMLAKV